MESVAHSSKEQLIYLTSRDGDLYLDEIISLINNCIHLIRLINFLYTNVDNRRWLDATRNEINAIYSLLNVFQNLKKVYMIILFVNY